MKPKKMPESNRIYTKPEGWDEGSCLDLHVYQGQDTDGHPVIISEWELSDEEVLQVLQTRSIYLTINTHIQPPVLLSIESPFENPDTPTPEKSIVLNIGIQITAEETYLDVQNTDVPKSLILEALSNFTQQLASEIIKELQDSGLKPDDIETGILERLKEDRQKIRQQLNPTKIIQIK